MAYIFTSLLIIALSVVLNVLWNRCQDRRRELFFANSILASAGVLIFVIASVYVKIKLSGSGDSYDEWAYDMMRVYWELMVPVSGVLFLIIMLTAFAGWFDVNLRRGFSFSARTITSVLSCAFVLIIGWFLSMTGENTTLPLASYMRIMTASLSLAYRGVYAVEYRSHLLNQRGNVKLM